MVGAGPVVYVLAAEPGGQKGDDVQQELALAANWFFHGHLNKLTAEAAHFAFGETATTRTDGWRYRLQWDVSF